MIFFFDDICGLQFQIVKVGDRMNTKKCHKSQVRVFVFICVIFPGLASEALVSGKLLWKTRPKYHKFLGTTCMLSIGKGH